MASRPQKTVFVSNLNLQTTDNEFEEAFKQFGTIKKAFIVKKEGQKSKGFGYIIFDKEDDCKKCIKSKVELEGNKLKIVKAKPKLQPDDKKQQTKTKVIKDDDDNEDDKDDDDNDDNDDEDDDNKKNPKDIKKSKEFGKIMKKIQLINNKKQDKENDMECDDDDDDDSEDEEMEVDQDESKIDEEYDDEGDEDDEEEDDEDDDEEEGDDETEDEDGDGPPQKKRKVERQLNNNDAEEGRTLFIRNLSFDSVEDDLEEFFEEFGDLHYCRIVMDQKSERSRGMAFVRFRTKEDAENCLKEYESNPIKFSLTGRRLNLTLAVTKDEAKNKFQKQVREEEGSKRNLHLIRVTMIRAGTKAAEGMSKEDIQMRESILSSTKEKLKNPNIFVSPVRLCIRNIPFEIDDKRLKAAFLKAAGGGKEVRITESRIMRDNTKPRSNGRPCMSKGFGFVTFTVHEHALAAAMATNNATTFGEKKRLIVEFSLENKAVYELREKRLEKSKQNVNIPRDQRKFKKGPTDKKFQIQKVPKTKPGQKDLPTHWGPKIRHKTRSNQDNKKKPFKKQQPKPKQEKDIKRQNKKKRSSVREISDNVDAMVRKRKMERPRN